MLTSRRPQGGGGLTSEGASLSVLTSRLEQATCWNAVFIFPSYERV
jgi:hypothetical protein